MLKPYLAASKAIPSERFFVPLPHQNRRVRGPAITWDGECTDGLNDFDPLLAEPLHLTAAGCRLKVAVGQECLHHVTGMLWGAATPSAQLPADLMVSQARVGQETADDGGGSTSS